MQGKPLLNISSFTDIKFIGFRTVNDIKKMHRLKIKKPQLIKVKV
jgi:hypothetical protein